jgi:addiction module HigA family antidote
MKNYIKIETVGTVLKEEFIESNCLTIEQVANAISVPLWKLLAVIEGGEQMTADLDLLLTKYFGMSEGFFVRWQESYNARIAKRQLRKKLAEIIPLNKLNKIAVL